MSEKMKSIIDDVSVPRVGTVVLEHEVEIKDKSVVKDFHILTFHPTGGKNPKPRTLARGDETSCYVAYNACKILLDVAKPKRNRKKPPADTPPEEAPPPRGLVTSSKLLRDRKGIRYVDAVALDGSGHKWDITVRVTEATGWPTFKGEVEVSRAVSEDGDVVIGDRADGQLRDLGVKLDDVYEQACEDAFPPAASE